MIMKASLNFTIFQQGLPISLSQDNMCLWISLGIYTRQAHGEPNWNNKSQQLSRLLMPPLPFLITVQIQSCWVQISVRLSNFCDADSINLPVHAFCGLSQLWKWEIFCRELVWKPSKLLFVHNLGIPLQVAGLQKPEGNLHFSQTSSPTTMHYHPHHLHLH